MGERSSELKDRQWNSSKQSSKKEKDDKRVSLVYGTISSGPTFDIGVPEGDKRREGQKSYLKKLCLKLS